MTKFMIMITLVRKATLSKLFCVLSRGFYSKFKNLLLRNNLLPFQNRPRFRKASVIGGGLERAKEIKNVFSHWKKNGWQKIYQVKTSPLDIRNNDENTKVIKRIIQCSSVRLVAQCHKNVNQKRFQIIIFNIRLCGTIHVNAGHQTKMPKFENKFWISCKVNRAIFIIILKVNHSLSDFIHILMNR